MKFEKNKKIIKTKRKTINDKNSEFVMKYFNSFNFKLKNSTLIAPLILSEIIGNKNKIATSIKDNIPNSVCDK